MAKKQYRHLFFDLDHTLWDFDSNARETLLELYDTYKLKEIGLPDAQHFIAHYTENNHRLWAQYHRGEISKETLRQTRFRKTFVELGLSPELVPEQFEDDYVNICPTKKNLFPGTLETLNYLKERYALHIITNGFYESSMLKMNTTGLTAYFQTINCSEIIGSNKPDPKIFEHALTAAGARKEESLMIGDSLEADIAGARAFGLDCIYFNPLNRTHDYPALREIREITELIDLL